MKQSMKKAALVLMLALAVLLVPQWSNTALAVTTPSDITTGSDLRFGMDAVPGGCFAGDHQKRRYYHQTCGIHALCAGVGGAEKRPVALCELPPVHCAGREKNHRQRAHDVC